MAPRISQPSQWAELRHIYTQPLTHKSSPITPHNHIHSTKNLFPQTKQFYQSRSSSHLIRTNRQQKKRTMCKELRYYYSICQHSGGSQFQYCRYAFEKHDEQLRYRKHACSLTETVHTQIAGMCDECRERARRAEDEAIAAYIRGRRWIGHCDCKVLSSWRTAVDQCSVLMDLDAVFFVRIYKGIFVTCFIILRTFSIY